jgi:putative oxygen-independent coproporphyrinogen III oxidase
MPKKPIGIYIHIPFCVRKCPYCDFYSVKPDGDLINLYTAALCKEIQANSKIYKRSVDSVYFGGGTPSLIGTKNIDKIIKTLNKCFSTIEPEVTIELNPSCHSEIDFHELKKLGINRVSLGMQSINNHELIALGRSHTSFDTQKSIYNLKAAGINNISLDIMIATPNQKKEALLSSLKFCVDNAIPHISIYLLKIEKNTKFFKIKDSLLLPSEDTEAKFYLFSDSFLSSNGYKHYEISNFCKNGLESRHNLKYWNCDEYLGFGPSAHSFINGRRFFYKRSLAEFIENPVPIPDGVGGSFEEYCMLRLRLFDGLSENECKAKFGKPIPKIFYEKASKYTNSNFVSISQHGINLTPKGFLVSNALISEIIL